MDINNINIKQQFDANCLFLYKGALLKATPVFINSIDISLFFEDYEGYPVSISELDKAELKQLASDTRVEAERVLSLSKKALSKFLKEKVTNDEPSE